MREAESNPVKPKLRRNRIILSCQPCHKRKQQCDRGYPCSRCVNRGCPDVCIYEEPKELKRREGEGSIQDNSIDVPSSRQLNGSNSAINSESIVLAEISGSVHDNAVQVAATALSQLSQQEAPDNQHPFSVIQSNSDATFRDTT
ncbi:hypothetical protein B0F90DRAFT_491403 [Multifurca ochricompacta]|uniref:Zn(2)-C6 fungal-type domain-containing protein n=1 Tax=Multifurca ochricompacta TaxID=376703 RepID=A0AAD4MAN6_9AGAM|nr:hypothetical protein B0F90DRAFT_491403 [Multifurca ochricompacta]